MSRKNRNKNVYQKSKEVREVQKDLYTPKYKMRVVPDKRPQTVSKEQMKEWMDLLNRPLE